MKYTIINKETQAPFIQQQYDSIEEANERFAALQQKSARHYPLVIVGVDEEGAFHEVTDTQEAKKETA